MLSGLRKLLENKWFIRLRQNQSLSDTVFVFVLGPPATLRRAGALGRLGESDDIVSFSFKRMTVRQRGWYGRRKVKVAVDGEVTRMKPPLEFEVI